MNAKSKTASARILLVGLQYGLPDSDYDEFYTDKHFLDYDIVIMDPAGALIGQKYDYTRSILDGVLTPNDGAAFHKRYTEITRKLVKFANKGGFAIVFLRPMPTLSYNDQRGDIVTVSLEMQLFGNSIRRAHGSNIKFTTQGHIGQFWKTTSEPWRYEAVYDNPPGALGLAHVRGHPDEVVADLIETKERGIIIMSPVPNFGINHSERQIEDEREKLFIPAVKCLHKALRNEGHVPQLPDWANDYSLPGEIEIRAEISAASGQVDALQEQVRQRTKSLDELCLHKLLVTGHNSALEGAVDRVLTDLGLKVEPGPKGRVDRIATYKDRKFAVEVQGVKRGAKEDHARALTIWVQEVALQDGGKEPKGLLVVNPYRDTPLAERGGNNLWSGETIEICKRQDHCAMTGLQLLGLYLDAMADDTKRERLIERMFRTQGLFEGYEDWIQFLAPVESKASNKS